MASTTSGAPASGAISRSSSEERRNSILPYIHSWAKGGAHVSGVDAVRGFNQTFEMRKTCGTLFTEVDALLSPTNPIVSYPAEWASPTNDPARPFEHIGFTVPWNMSEQPAASINCGFSKSGMPIGLQIVGPRYRRHARAEVVESLRGLDRRRHSLAAAAGQLIGRR